MGFFQGKNYLYVWSILRNSDQYYILISSSIQCVTVLIQNIGDFFAVWLQISRWISCLIQNLFHSSHGFIYSNSDKSHLMCKLVNGLLITLVGSFSISFKCLVSSNWHCLSQNSLRLVKFFVLRNTIQFFNSEGLVLSYYVKSTDVDRLYCLLQLSITSKQIINC